MKNRQFAKSCRAIVLFGLIIFGAYFVTPAVKASYCRNACSFARVYTLGGSMWQDAQIECDYVNPPTVLKVGPCGPIDVYAGAVVYYPPCGGPAFGSPTVSGGRSETITNGSGYAIYRLYPPDDPSQLPVTFTVSARATGSIRSDEDELSGSTNCDSGVTLSAQATIIFTSDASCGSGSCSASSPSFGSGNADNNSVDFRLNLGHVTPQIDGGFLWLKASSPSTLLSQPQLLQVPWQETGVEIIKDTYGTIQQVKVSQGLINIHIINAFEYHLECFYTNNVTPKTGGLYGTNAVAYCTYVIVNPDGVTSSNRLNITEERGGISSEFQYTYSALHGQWDLLKPDGQTLSTWKIADVSDATVTNCYRQVSAGGNIVSLTQRTYKYVSAINSALITQEIDGTGSQTRTTTYTYYTSGANVNHVQKIVYPEGKWVYYDYDGYGRKTNEYSPFNNSAPPISGEPDPLVDHCKSTQYIYFGDPSIDNDVPWTTIVNIPVQAGGGSWSLQEVSRSYHESIANIGYDEIQQCPDPGGSWGDSGNAVTATTKWTSGTFTTGRPISILHPDGTTTYYNYPDQYTTIETAPDGSQTTNIVDDWGNILSVTKTDTSTGVVLTSNVYTYTNSSGVYFDNLRRTYFVTDLAGRTNYYTYDCCNLDSQVDSDGVTTAYDYDSLKRRIASTVIRGAGDGVKTSTILDAVGRELVVQRTGTDLSAPITLQQTQYDVLGNVFRQTNALGGITAATNEIVSSQRRNSTTNADGGTIVELYQRDGRLQSRTGTAVHPVQYTYGIEQDGSSGPWREFTQETKLDAGGSPTSEWVKTYRDGMGRDYKTIYAAASGPYPYSQLFYNEEGRAWKQVDADGNITYFIYYDFSADINQGQQQYKIVALDSSTRAITDYGTLESSLSTIQGRKDRITRMQMGVIPANGVLPDLITNMTYFWNDGETDGVGTLVSSAAFSTDGLRDWNTVWNNGIGVTTADRTIYAANGFRFSTNVAPDGSFSINTNLYGHVISTVKKDGTGSQISLTTNGYDIYDRQNIVWDARNGATTYTFNNADQMSSLTTPPPASGTSAQVTSNYFDNMFHIWKVLQADNTSMTNEFYLTGDLRRVYGSRTFPVGYGYDPQGRMTTMTNWSSFASNAGSRVTTWGYNAYRGFLTSKTYAGGVAGPIYAYTSGGRLQSRLWARGTNASYTYNNAGELATVHYNDGATSGVTNNYDRRGRLNIITNSPTVCTKVFNDANSLLSETLSGGPLNGISITNGYDKQLRRTNNVILNGSSVLAFTTNNFDSASRLLTISDGINAATYTYAANAALVSQIIFTQSGATRMTTRKNYDYLNRLTSTSSEDVSTTVLTSQSYTLNNADQRTYVTNADGTYWAYHYDTLGQVVSGIKHWSDGSVIAGQQFGYGFDDIGNRVTTSAGGDQWGANLRYASYSANNLNQYSSRTVPSSVDIIGSATNAATITVNDQPTSRHGNYYRGQLFLNNSAAAVWMPVTNLASMDESTNFTLQTNVIGNVFVSQTPESFGYDADGNLTNDGRWSYAWDAENRLVEQTSLGGAPTGSKLKLDFLYDSTGRRIQKVVCTNDGSSYIPEYTNNFAYDSWNLIGELMPNKSLIRSYMWGVDLSGVLQGDGGIGGLLKMAYYGSSATNCFVCCDGNGDVTELVNAADGNILARYEYGAFGEAIRITGSMSRANPLRFSTKYQDDESDYLYYGLRYLNTSTGKWLTKDPLGDVGSLNLYSFVNNNPISEIDPDGEISIQTTSKLPGDCGEWEVRFTIMLTAPAPEGGGYLVQRIETTDNITDKDGMVVSTAHNVYFEAWPIRAGDKQSGSAINANYTDHSHNPTHKNTNGTSSSHGELRFYAKNAAKDVKKWSAAPGGPAETLPHTSDPPSFWDPMFRIIEGPVSRDVSGSWSCCCGSTDTKTKLDVTP